MNLIIIGHLRFIQLVLFQVVVEQMLHLMKLVAAVHIMLKTGHTRPEKHMTVGMYTVGIERLNEEVLKWKLTKKKR